MQPTSNHPRARLISLLLALLLAMSLAFSGCQLGRRSGAVAPETTGGAGLPAEASASQAGGNSEASQSPAGSVEASGAPGAANESEGPDADVEEAVVVDTVPDPVPLELEPIASVRFELDSTKTVERGCDPRNGGTLSVVDAQGTAWTLTIPPFALTSTQTIRMTPVASVTMAGGASIFHGGVVLEPDGLTFLVPARMAVVPKGGEAIGAGDDREPILVSGTFDGSLREWVLPERMIAPDAENPDVTVEATGYPVSHFSSLVFTDRGTLREQKTIPGLEKEAQARLDKTMDMANKFLKEHKNQIDVPVPPVYPLECQKQEDQQSLDDTLGKFLEKAREPESELVGFLLRDLAALNLVEAQDTRGEEVYDLSRRLLWRNHLKAVKLMDQYRGQPDVLLPVSLFAMRAAQEASQLLTYGEGEEAALLERVTQFLSSSVKPLLEDLRVNHNYRQARSLLRIAGWQTALGLTYDSIEPLIGQINKALRFELELDVHYVTLDSDYGVFGVFPLRFDEFLNYMQGKNMPGFTFVTSVPDTTMSGAPDMTSIIVPEFNPCEGKGRFALDRFWATGEVMTSDGESIPIPVTQRWWEFSFAEYKTDTGEDGFPGMAGTSMYSFPFAVQNGQEIAAEGEVKGKHNAGNKLDITFTYRLRHTPK